MNQTIIIESNRHNRLRAVAWVCLALCVAIVALAGGIATVTSTKRIAALDPLPALRWDDVR